MNYDRFLTRVWDKQEKKMLYYNQGIFIHSDRPAEYQGFKYLFKGCTDQCIIAFSLDGLGSLHEIPFGDRFIPMQCSGWKDGDNKRLIYQHDILESVYYKGDKQQRIICGVDFCELTCGFEVSDLFNTAYLGFRGSLGITIACKNKILGNIFENPELMEKSE